MQGVTGKLGENSKIGAGSVVINEVPPNCTVVGIPGRVVKREDERIPRINMDHRHLPDPVLDDIITLRRQNDMLAQRLSEMEKEMQHLKTEKEIVEHEAV